MGPQNPPGYGPPPAGGYGGGGGYGPPGFGPPPGPGGPGGFGGPPPGFGGGDRMAAEGKIKPAAITLMVFTGIGMLLQIVSLFMNVLGTGVNLANSGNNNDAAAQLMSGVGGIVMNVVGLLAGGFCIYAFLKMMKLQGRGLAYTAIIFSMLPCLGSCWCVNLWIGIWALIAMSDQNVKASFT
jgi:hypothetical protein